MKCLRKHTKYQVEKEDWACPQCGETAATAFFLESPCEYESAVHYETECSLMHMDEWVVCYQCDYSVSANSFANRVRKSKSLITCPCCKGKGFVPAPKDT